MPVRTALCAALAAAALAAGCGGGDEATTTAADAPPEPATTAEQAGTTQATPPDETGDTTATAPQRRRLRAKGYDVEQTKVSGAEPSLQAALELPLKSGAAVTVYAFATEDDARAKEAELQALADAEPRGFRVARRGTRVYFGLAEEGPLSPQAFGRVVAAAEAE
jgi:hypothetical protein